MLTAGELTLLRSDLEDTLPDTCVITPQTQSADGAGGWTVSNGTPVSVACRYYPDAKPVEGVSQGRQRGTRQWIVEVPQGTGINLSDRITVSGLVFEVRGFKSRSEELLRRVLCAETV